MSQKYEKLKTLLKELFQLDQPDLDFGLYRIMHAKSAEVTQFLDKDLLPQVQQAFGLYKTADKAELEKELAKAIEQAQSHSAAPETLPKVKDLRAKLANDAVDIGGLENEVYDHLFSFFRRYYSEGDFLAKQLIEKGDLKPWEFNGMKAVWFGRHLYEPLLYLDSNIVEISPAPLNKGERVFVEDLKAFHDGHPEFFKGRELYLLRNLSKGRGVGFFEAGNFHPDFILWLLVGGQQHVIFVDPKGIRNIGISDPKIQFHQTIKEIEERLGDSG